MQREYEEFKVRLNGLVSISEKVPEEGWTMQDGTPWPGNNVHDHPGMIQVIFYRIFTENLFYKLHYSALRVYIFEYVGIIQIVNM